MASTCIWRSLNRRRRSKSCKEREKHFSGSLWLEDRYVIEKVPLKLAFPSAATKTRVSEKLQAAIMQRLLFTPLSDTPHAIDEIRTLVEGIPPKGDLASFHRRQDHLPRCADIRGIYTHVRRLRPDANGLAQKDLCNIGRKRPCQRHAFCYKASLQGIIDWSNIQILLYLYRSSNIYSSSYGRTRLKSQRWNVWGFGSATYTSYILTYARTLIR